MCDHTIAMQRDTFFSVATLPERIKNEVYDWNSYERKMCNLNGNDPKLVKPLDFIDGRKGYMHLFCYCPNCGEKINWGEIKNLIASIEAE